MQDRHILVVEDDPAIRALLRACFEEEGARVSEVATACEVRSVFSTDRPDLVTLDVALGGEDGFSILRQLRREFDTPVIMVSGRDDVIDKVVGLELGADDYLTKPFHIREVLARAKCVLRRYGSEPHSDGRAGHDTASDEETKILDGLQIDLKRMSLRNRRGADCDLTTADFKLLRAFLDNAERPLSRDRLMDLIDGPDWVPLDRTIDNQVARLRKKIERDASHPKLIKTVRGIGYMLTERPQAMAQLASNTA